MRSIATKSDLKRRTLTELASNPDFITGIYNYCDRWCERCPFSSRCLVYASEQEGASLVSQEATNGEFWRRLQAVYQEARERIDEWSKEAGLGTGISEDDIARHQKKRRGVDTHPIARAAKKYANAAGDWFLDLTEGENPAKQQVEDLEATDVVKWYQYQIAVKTMRALSERGDDIEGERSPKDSDGVAKVALVGIERSISAWRWIQTIIAAKADSIVPLILQLEQLRIAIEREFPDARSFVRPGFDEVADLSA